MSLFRRKPLDALIADGSADGRGLKKELTWIDLTALGIGGVIGAGIFATLGTATAGGAGGPPAGPGVLLSIVLTAIACGFCALCYAELASLVPVAGSAYSYGYATLGELAAWIIGWDLILEYAVSSVAVAISWAAYFRQLLLGLGIQVPAWMATDYRSALMAAEAAKAGGAAALGPEAALAYQAYLDHPRLAGVPVICNLLAVAVTVAITWLLVVGIRGAARFNNLIVVLKVAALLFFMAAGALYVRPANWHPFFPGGAAGIWGGASLIFFAYIGFDAISTTAEECRDPGRDLPGSILGSLLICMLLYCGTALVLTGMIPFRKLAGCADPLAAALSYVGQDVAAGVLSLGAVVALTSVLLVCQIGQPRILLAMSRDGLLGPWFGRIHPRHRTPHVTTILTGIFVAFFSAVANVDEIVQLTNIGTLFAFVLVCAGVLILRVREPDRPRRFRAPLVPLTPVLGILMCLVLMAGLPLLTWGRFLLWLGAGLLVYFLYGRRRSRLAR
jgi:APA family basic amino acid/polyamine antiporter